MILLVAGLVLGAIGAFVDPQRFAYSYLLAYMFFLSICLGGLFLVILHHLFDASWSVPIRRICEHLACLLPVMAVLWIPIFLYRKSIFPWMSYDPHADHALHAKAALINPTAFWIVPLIMFALWTWLSLRLRYWSLEQDRTGSAACTRVSSSARTLSGGASRSATGGRPAAARAVAWPKPPASRKRPCGAGAAWNPPTARCAARGVRCSRR